ncbi:hypothetical protein [Rhizobium sp. P44RR-XXIV]|uniref:hypothetical protein n=1 Tax=Rhizobium sp. P44RR-XXIV TaxID=1921145 RepID=UPI000987D477|nr:hypothetical protein [Rhizobium sp. P44RR-XXIV]TIX89157.1 hypothetical protein BSK43_021340 [Rhizobium sp. P44RR-XXIV]
MSIDGFYAGYMTAAGGSGVALFILKEGALIGVDLGGVQFDGAYDLKSDGSYGGKVKVTVPPGVTIIQGITAPPTGMAYEVDLKLSATFLTDPYFEIVTPIGKVNARLQKLRDA